MKQSALIVGSQIFIWERVPDRGASDWKSAVNRCQYQSNFYVSPYKFVK